MGIVQSVPVIRHFVEIMDDRARTVAELGEVLDEVGSEHALVGGLAVGLYGRPRATIDVDLLVPRAKIAAIASALERRGHRCVRHEDTVRVYEKGAPEDSEPVVDLVIRESNPVLKAAAKTAHPAKILGHDVNVVSRGALVALKFHAAISPTRRIGDRYQDIADIERVIAREWKEDDEKTALAIARQMHPGAPEELARLVADLKAGRPVKL